MLSLGPYLRDLRERRGVSLEEIARVTRVAHRYLEALESESFALLPASVFTRGFIRAYCQALGEPPDEALARLGNPQGETSASPPPSAMGSRVGAGGRSAEGTRRGRGAVLVSFVLLVVLGIALFVVALALQSDRDGGAARRATVTAATPTPPESPAPAIPPAPSPTPTVVSGPVPPGSASTVPGSRGEERGGGAFRAPYRLVARTTEPTWIRVRTQEGRVSEETIPPGQVREWISDRPLVLTVGNAGGVALELNGRPLPSLGASGAVINGLVVPPGAP